MSYCLNPNCQHRQNLEATRFCQSCGSTLLLKERYRAIQVLGQSSIGQTLLAVDEDQPSQPYCVIKHFFPKDAGISNQKALVGAHRISELGKHPQIPQLWASFELDGHQYLVQEYVDGVSLARELEDAGPFNETKIRALIKDVLPVLRFVHNHQMIHGDIKPENIIQRQSDAKPQAKSLRRFVLVDFANDLRALSGSAEYVAPEQAKGQAFACSDLYSLGVTCIHLLTDISPFDLFDIKADSWTWRDYLKTPVSYQLGLILDKLIQRNPKQRYQSVAEVIKDLNSWKIAPPSLPQKRLAISAISGAAVAIVLGTLSSRGPAPVPYSSYTTYKTPVTLPEMGYSTPDVWRSAQPMRTLAGNSGPFWSVAVSPDGHKLASGSFDGTIQVWRLGASERKTTLEGHSGAVWSVAISPDGETLASGSEDKTVKLWNLRTGQLENTFFGHSDAVFSVAFSPDGKTLATVSEDKTIKLWNWQTGELIRTLHGHSAEVQSVAFTPDGKMLATGSTDGTVKLWNARTGNLLRTMLGHSDAVWSVAISPDGQTLASASWDRTIKLWDLESGQMLNTLIGHSEQVQSVAFSPDGQMLASGDVSGTIKLWQLSTGTQMGTLKGHSAWVEVAFSPIGKTLVSGGFDDTIKLWSLCP